MKNKIPMNGLDQAVWKAARKASAIPEFYRALAAGTDGQLWFLVEAWRGLDMAKVELNYGEPSPFVCDMLDDHGPVLLFSSAERANEYLEEAGVAAGTYVVVSKPVRKVLYYLGLSGAYATINNQCATGSIKFPAKVMSGLARGTLLQPTHRNVPTYNMGFTVLKPLKWPSGLVSLFHEMMQKHRQFKAAWIMRRNGADDAPKDELPTYYVLIWMDPKDDAILHELELVAQVYRGSNKVGIEINAHGGPGAQETFATMFSAGRFILPFTRLQAAVKAFYRELSNAISKHEQNAS